MMKSTHTPPRSVRIPTPIWEAAKRTAAARGETVTDAIVRGLERYARDELRAAKDAEQDPTPA